MQDGTEPTPARVTGVRRILREPLLQFMALGALIFAAASLLGPSSDAPSERIVVNDAVAGRLASLYDKQMGVQPDAVQLKTLVDNYIEEEVLYREALRLGLDRDDEIVRRRLAQKMRFLAARTFDDPSVDALKAFYESHPDDFMESAKVSFRHLYFSPDKDGPDAARARAEDALAILKPGCGAEACTAVGNPFPLQGQYSSLGPRDAAQLFGNTQIVDALFSAPPGTWAGPFASGYGWHLVNISEREASFVPPYEEVKDKVLSAYEADSSERQTREAIAQMTARYQIIREDGEGAQ